MAMSLIGDGSDLDAYILPKGFYPGEYGIYCERCDCLVGDCIYHCYEHHCVDCYYCGGFNNCYCEQHLTVEQFLVSFNEIPTECLENDPENPLQPGDIGYVS